jgi:hypothetical protein
VLSVLPRIRQYRVSITVDDAFQWQLNCQVEWRDKSGWIPAFAPRPYSSKAFVTSHRKLSYVHDGRYRSRRNAARLNSEVNLDNVKKDSLIRLSEDTRTLMLFNFYNSTEFDFSLHLFVVRTACTASYLGAKNVPHADSQDERN